MYSVPMGGLAATGLNTGFVLIGAWVLIMAGVALFQIARRPKRKG